MKTTTQRAAEALDLPEELREPAVAYLLEQAEKFRVLKENIAEGMDDLAARASVGVEFRDFSPSGPGSW